MSSTETLLFFVMKDFKTNIVFRDILNSNDSSSVFFFFEKLCSSHRCWVFDDFSIRKNLSVSKFREKSQRFTKVPCIVFKNVHKSMEYVPKFCDATAIW